MRSSRVAANGSIAPMLPQSSPSAKPALRGFHPMWVAAGAARSPQADAGDVVAVGIGFRHEHRIGRLFDWRHRGRIDRGRLMHDSVVHETADVRKVCGDLAGRYQRAIGAARIAACRRRRRLRDPAVHRHQQRAQHGTCVERIARQALDELLAADPVAATALGDHRFDDRLPDLSPEGLDETCVPSSVTWLAAVDSVDDTGLTPDNRVDHEILRSALSARLFELDRGAAVQLGPARRQPGHRGLPAAGPRLRAARRPAPLGGRAAGRGPEAALATARAALRDMPRVHVETAIGQFLGTRTLVAGQVDARRSRPGAVAPGRGRAGPGGGARRARRAPALAASRGSPTSDRDPRLGAELYAGRLWHTLDTEISADTRARPRRGRPGAHRGRDRRGGRRPRRHDERARRAGGRRPRRRHDGLPLCEQALRDATEFVRVRTTWSPCRRREQLVEIIVMPEIHRGVAVAYCDPPGPLERATAADLLRGLADAGGLAGGAGRARSTGSTTPTCCATSPCTRRCRGTSCSCTRSRGSRGSTAGARGVLERAVRRGLGGLRRGAHGRALGFGGPRGCGCSSSRCSCG